MKVGKICPFRVYQNVQGSCESECQLFIPAKTPNEGRCALSALPLLEVLSDKLSAIKQTMVSLDHTIVNSVRTITAK